jgi:hypothetical protein
MFDPIESPTNRGIPYYSYVQAREHDDILKKARSWCRYFYISHNIVPTAIDIMARFPLVGFENYCSDQSIQDFYDELFIDDLSYEQKLIEIGLELWKTGESFSLGDWSSDLGVWVGEELLNPDDVLVHRITFPRMEAYQLDISDHLHEVINTDKFPFEKQAIELVLPGIIDNIKHKRPIDLPSQNLYVMQQRADPWANRGTPLLMRAFRQLMLEERLNRAQCAISERLFTPFILIKLGLNNIDGNGAMWMPNLQDLYRTQAVFENLMESDYRTLVHHFGITVEVPLSKEKMPDMDSDYERIENSILQVFGISRDLLSGGKGQQAYATTALSAEFLMQRLNTYQVDIKRFLRSRYEKVAEAQGFYEMEGPPFNRTPKVIRQLVVHENGQKEVVERNKLLIPEPRFVSMDFRDEKAQREFLTQLKESGVPISAKTMTKGVKYDPQEEGDMIVEESKIKAITEARIKKEVKEAVAEAGLGEYVDQAFIDKMTQDALEPVKVESPGMGGGAVVPVQTDEQGNLKQQPAVQTPTRPEQSDEQRKGMPRAATGAIYKREGVVNDSLRNLGIVKGDEEIIDAKIIEETE